MVSFSCEGCGDVLTKKKLDAHANQCRGASFTCLDCMVHFWGTEYRAHTSCISEAQKYQGALYRPEKEKKGKQNNQSKALVPQRAYVEDVQEEHNGQLVEIAPPMPEAPTPPSAAPGFVHQPQAVNVFDFLVDSETPNQSTLDLCAAEPMAMLEDTPQPIGQDVVRVRFEDENQGMTELVQYGNSPIAGSNFHTPAPKHERERERKKKEKDSKSDKKDKKRKRLHVDTHSLSPKPDEVMTDAPPVLHSGLTGGLNRLLRPDVFPPSPDYSGDAQLDSPGSPLKKTKHSKKRGRGDTISNIMSMMNPLSNSSREHSEDRPRKHRQRKHRDESSRPDRKMIEYNPMAEDADGTGDSQMVVYQPRAEMLLGFINKGPESERGVSMNKALKRYHRERHDSGSSLGRAEEEKELWRSLRMKKNDRGEIVLFL